MTSKILFISKGESASSTRYRALQYFPNFLTSGWQPSHKTISGGLFSIVNALVAAYQVDVVILLRKTFPYPILWLLRKLSKKLVFDFDDAIFCNTNGSDSKTRMHRFKQTVRCSDYIFAGNHYLAKQAQLSNSNVSVIPTSLNTQKYAITQEKSAKHIDIVWIGSQSTSKYLADILPALEKAAQQKPLLRLKIIADFTLTSDKLEILPIAWSEHTEAAELASAHIAVAPLRDDNWTRGKCALKVLQYMASSLPTISSCTGVNAEAIAHGTTGYFANSEDEWVSYILALAENEALRVNMGKTAQKAVQVYELNHVFSLMLNHINELYRH